MRSHLKTAAWRYTRARCCCTSTGGPMYALIKTALSITEFYDAPYDAV